MTGLANLRRFRERQRLGISVFKLPLDAVAVEEMLAREGLLDPMVDHSHAKVEGALAEFVTRLAATGFGQDLEDEI